MKRIDCPVCKLGTGFYEWPSVMNPDLLVSKPYPLYQRSYSGEKEYISPRCSRCYDKAEKKLAEAMVAE